MSLSLVTFNNAKPKTFGYTYNNVKQHMNGGEDIHIDSYKKSHLDSHQGDLVSDNVTKVALIAP